MTMPFERKAALKKTSEFLEWLVTEYNSKTKVSEVRDRARSCLRHYPWDSHIDKYFEEEDETFYLK